MFFSNATRPMCTSTGRSGAMPWRARNAAPSPGVKLVCPLWRRPDLTHEQFVRHWVDIHAPLAHAVPGVRRYVQNHIAGERTRADIPATEVAIDGVAELWFDDQAAMEAAARSPEMKALHADGARFIGRIRSYIGDEKVVIGHGVSS